MIIDSSALIAILFDEPEARSFTDAIFAAPARRMSTATWLETAIRIDGTRRPAIIEAFDTCKDLFGIELVDVTPAMATAARAAYRRFGKGSGSPARLNFGDCLVYGLAQVMDEAILFKGDDFPHTDIRSALA